MAFQQREFRERDEQSAGAYECHDAAGRKLFRCDHECCGQCHERAGFVCGDDTSRSEFRADEWWMVVITDWRARRGLLDRRFNEPRRNLGFYRGVYEHRPLQCCPNNELRSTFLPHRLVSLIDLKDLLASAGMVPAMNLEIVRRGELVSLESTVWSDRGSLLWAGAYPTDEFQRGRLANETLAHPATMI